jgi:hypothetical protein
LALEKKAMLQEIAANNWKLLLKKQKTVSDLILKRFFL